MWQWTISQRLRQLERHTLELNAWRNAVEAVIPHWTIQQPGFVPRAVKPGDAWGFTDGQNGYNTHGQGPVRLQASFVIPESFSGRAVELELDVGGEGFVEILDANGATLYRGGLNPFHRSFPVLPRAAGGERFTVSIEAVPKGLFGSRNDAPRLVRSHLVAPEPDVCALVADLETLRNACTALDGHEVVGLLLAAAEKMLKQLPWTSSADAYRARLPATLGNPWEQSILWSLPADTTSPQPLESEFLEGVQVARTRLQSHLERVRALYPPQGKVALTGHAHIDLAWLWPVAETRRKIRRTFATVLELMKRFPDFTFNQSSAQAYAWLETDDPNMFEEVKARVLEGRWETVGGMWVEPDGQMPSGESWARQLLYGQGYFAQKFGRASSVAWLPDTFGFNPQLPQLLKLAGMTGFFTTKLSWNETTAFPHDLFHWRGLDGSTVLAHSFWNPRDSYNAVINPDSTATVWRNFKAKGNAGWLETDSDPQTLLSFGYGDGGGGPSREMLEEFERIRDYPGLPRLEMKRVDEFYTRLPQTDLPVWEGEMYLELHRGTLTTQGRTKKRHRDLETRLIEAEALGTLAWLNHAAPYPQVLEDLWKTLLLHEFHDILPGSSIREVYEDAERDLNAALEAATTLRDTSLEVTGTPIPSLETPARPAPDGDGFILENAFLTAVIGADGWLHRLHDREHHREVLRDTATLTVQRDLPREWEAWDVNPHTSATPIDGEVNLTALEDGVRVSRHWRESTITQTYRLRGRRLEIHNDVNWLEKRVLLRATVPVNVSSDTASFETAFGVVHRPTHGNLPDDAARFEVSAHRWADLSERGYGISLLNDGKYGHTVTRDALHLSLLRGSMYPDPNADLGNHAFTYAIYPHAGTPADARTALEATRFTSPLLSSLQDQLQVRGTLILLSALKRAESGDAITLRLYEPSGARGRSTLRWQGVKRAVRTDLLENELEASVHLEGDTLTLEVKPFEIVTLKLWLE
jgi:alpha-mannosidase